MSTVSVIIPTYNRANLLKETLESVFAQTYTDYEVIVIDDGSTDDTEEFVSALLLDHPQLRYIKQANAGVSAARNHGIFEARGEWIAFLDSDDLWFPDKLEKQMAFLAEHPSAGAVTNPFYRYQDGQVETSKQGDALRYPQAERVTSLLPFELFASYNYVNTSSVLIRKTLLYQAGLFEGGLKVGEDFILWVRIAKFAEFWFLNEVLGCCRTHETNTINDSEYQFYGRMVRELQIVRWSKEAYIVKLYKEWLAGHYAWLADDDRQKRKYSKAAHYYWLAVRHTQDLKQKARLFAMFIIAKFFPFVFRIWDQQQRRNF